MRNKPVTMNLADIKILSNFAESTPRREKYCKCAIYWIENHRQDRYLVINEDGYLIDGYIQYLVLKTMGEETAQVIQKRRKDTYRNRETVYIFGKHPGNEKEYVWWVPHGWEEFSEKVSPGDRVFVYARGTTKIITVTKVEKLVGQPIDVRIKKVASRKIFKGGQQ